MHAGLSPLAPRREVTEGPCALRGVSPLALRRELREGPFFCSHCVRAGLHSNHMDKVPSPLPPSHEYPSPQSVRIYNNIPYTKSLDSIQNLNSLVVIFLLYIIFISSKLLKPIKCSHNLIVHCPT